MLQRLEDWKEVGVDTEKGKRVVPFQGWREEIVQFSKEKTSNV
jgi:hypothetical protein